MSSLPKVNSNRSTDFHIQLMLCEPWRPGKAGYLFPFRDIFDLDVSFQRGEPGALKFSTYKTDKAAELLQRDDRPNERGGGTREYAVVVLLWDWRRKRYVEPDNARFIVSQWDEDAIDGTNKITYECVQEVEVLKKAVLMRTEGDYQLNKAYDKAKEAYDEAERNYDRLMNEGVRLAKEIKKDRFGHQNGLTIIGYRGTDWIKKKYPNMKWGTLVADTQRDKLVIWRPSTRSWLTLPDSGTKTDTERRRLVRVSRELRAARNLMNRRRDAFAKAEHAARDTSRDGTRYFYKRTPARVIQRAWLEAGMRDASHRFAVYPNPDAWRDTPHGGPLRYQLKGFYRDWTTTKDSKGKSWIRNTTQANWEFPLGISLFDMVQDFRERGELDWTCRGSTFSLVPFGGLEVDQSRRVALRIDDGTEEATERGSRLEHHSVTFVVAGNGYGYDTTYAPNVAAMGTPWGPWEGTMTESDADGRAKAISLTQKAREERHYREVVDAQRRITVNPLSAIPGIDYQPHHWVSVWDHENSQSKRVVDQIILSWKGGEEAVEATITLGTRRTRRATQFGRTLAKTLSGRTHIQGHIPMEPRLVPPQMPSEVLRGPTISNLEAAVRINATSGQPSVVLRAQWAVEGLIEPDGIELITEDTSSDVEDDGTATG